MTKINYDLQLETSSSILSIGGTILYPTDTIWGIGCDATNEAAIQKIYHIKQRPTSKQFIVLFASVDMLREYLTEELDLSFIGAESEPTTYVLNQRLKLPALLISEENTVAVRIPKNDFCIDLISQFGKPIVSTSANKSGEATPFCFQSIDIDLINNIDYCLPLDIESGTGRPSKIVIWQNNKWHCIR